MSNLGDRVRILGTQVTGRLMMVYTDHYHDDKWLPCKIVLDDGSHTWLDPDGFVGHRGLCPECKMYAKAPEGGFLPGHPCVKNYGRCDTELVYEVNDG